MVLLKIGKSGYHRSKFVICTYELLIQYVQLINMDLEPQRPRPRDTSRPLFNVRMVRQVLLEMYIQDFE